ncbi:MAG TPA: hypothetical protein VGL09_14570 [Methylomirabilota bacterium]
MTAARVAAVGLITGFGDGVRALPDDAARAAGRRRVIGIPRTPVSGERFRRATRECVLGVRAVNALLAEAGESAGALAGTATALVYVTAAAYGAANRAFIESTGGSAGTLHFPYTAPSAVPAEVAIEFGLRGDYAILLGDGSATEEALWHATTLLGRGACARVLVLAVETFEECADLYARGRWLVRWPLVEAAACALLVPGEPTTPAPASAVRARSGETGACAPLIGFALALAEGGVPAP